MSEFLPLEAQVSSAGRGWASRTIRVPVRSEDIRLEKRVVVAERVSIRRIVREAIAHFATDVRQERARVRVRQDPDATQPLV